MFKSNKKGLSAVDATNVKDLTKLIKEVPQYQKDLKKYNTNFRLAEDCVKEQDRVRLLCKIEQVYSEYEQEEPLILVYCMTDGVLY